MRNDTYEKALSLAVVLAILACPVAAFAQEAPPIAPPADDAAGAPAGDAAPAGPVDLPNAWREFLHYIRLARPDAALAYGKAILQSDPDPKVIYRLSMASDEVVVTLARGERLEGLADTVRAIRKLAEQGYKLTSRDAKHIIESVDMLGGPLRQFMIGLDRLVESGEFAVPFLVQRLSESTTDLLVRGRIIVVFEKIGKNAVRPLCEALNSPDPAVRRVIAQVLGKIGYWHSAPYLRVMLDNDAEIKEVKVGAAAALVAVAGDEAAVSKPTANFFYELAERYYGNAESLRPDQRYDVASVWYWDTNLKALVAKEVPTAVFRDVYAMRCARSALLADDGFTPAVSLWLAANIRKEARLPAGATDATKGANQLSADAYAKAAGAKYMQAVLSRAMRDGDADVAARAIMGLAKTTRSDNLAVAAAGGATPLAAALTYPDRRVRFLAARTLADARPKVAFGGSELVLSVLVEALRQTGTPIAMLVEGDTDKRNQWKAAIRGAGLEVVDSDYYGTAAEAATKVSGIDVVVLGMSITKPDVEEALRMMRADPVYAAQPVVLLANEGQLSRARQFTRAYPAVSVLASAGLDDAVMKTALTAAMAKTAGSKPMDEDEAASWALTAAQSLRMLGVTGTTVFNLNRAEPALYGGLTDKRDQQKIACARALAVINSGQAQQAIVAMASAADVAEPVRVAAYVAAAESVRAIGNQLADPKSRAVVELVASPGISHELRDAASELLGALDLPTDQIKTLIVGQK